MFSPRLLQKGTSVFTQIECFSLSAHTQVVVDKTLSLKFIIIKKIINMYRAWFFVFNLPFVLHRVFQKTGKRAGKNPFYSYFCAKHTKAASEGDRNGDTRKKCHEYSCGCGEKSHSMSPLIFLSVRLEGFF